MQNLEAWIFVPLMVMMFAVRAYWGVRADKRPVQESKSFIWDKINIGMMNLGLLIFPLLALFTDLLRPLDYFQVVTLAWVSIPFLLTSIWLVWLSHRDLGENWSVTLEIKQGHELVTRGIFSRIRHPMYLSIWLWVIGQALLIPNWLGGAGALVIWSVLYFVRIEREERMMLDQFGTQYSEYMGRTSRLVPGLI